MRVPVPLRLTVLVVAFVTCCLSIVTSTSAQSPVADALRTMQQRSAKNLIAGFEAIPADKYGFKPTAAQLSIGDITVHLAGGNDYLCSKIGGVAAPKRSELAGTAAKEALIARLTESFKFCETALAKLNDSDLSGMVPFFGARQVTRAYAILATAEDWGDHYSQLAIYMRLNGLLPPTAKKGGD